MARRALARGVGVVRAGGRRASGALLIAALLGASVLTASRVQAQDEVQRRREASQAYDRATILLDRGYYGQAGRWFMTAYRLVPARVALIQGVRSYQQAGDLLRAGTLALLLRDEYGADATAISLADQVIHEASVRYHRIEVNCGGCTVQVNERLIDGHGLFVEAGRTHQLVFYWGNRQATQEVSGVAGEVSELEIEAPPDVEVDDDTLAGGEGARATVETRPPLHRAAFITGAVLTAVGVGATIFSVVDMYNGVDAYEAQAGLYTDRFTACNDGTLTGDDCSSEALAALEASAQSLLDDGQAREVRSTALLYSTVGIAAVTTIFAIYTDWNGPRYDSDSASQGGDSEDDGADPVDSAAEQSALRLDQVWFRPGIAPTPNGAIVSLEGTL